MENKFPVRLRKLRERKHVSQCVVSELCGLNKNAVRLYERGESEPTITSFLRIADFFEVSADYLVGLTDDPSRKDK